MRIIRYTDGIAARTALIVEEKGYDLPTLGVEGVDTLADLLRFDEPLADAVTRLREAVSSAAPSFHVSGLFDSGRQPKGEGELRLLAPIDEQEVWAAGVTYKRSEEARKQESEGAAIFYADVYEAERPELFLKATPHRTVGSYDAVGIRFDANWNVPEPELGVVLNRRLEVLGYTIGNDMSSRDIEGANPLYLPQAKVYTRSCALGPAITLVDSVPDPHALKIRLGIHRKGQVAFEGQTDTGQMHRTLDDLISYLGRSNSFPDGVVLLTGTGIVPDESFTLQEDDMIEIEITGLGTLTNHVVRVGP